MDYETDATGIRGLVCKMHMHMCIHACQEVQEALYIRSDRMIPGEKVRNEISQVKVYLYISDLDSQLYSSDSSAGAAEDTIIDQEPVRCRDTRRLRQSYRE